ncbi:MAG: protein phosphatase 2C domain-containing protein [Nocardiopsaceae bacterium]|jgi:hypothetical protein|nr:protein phosphatase 2C domain-containing protein [Nocardiopsaceae bacterium]
MQISHATASTPGRPNEDYVTTGPDRAVILDGATAPTDVESGCIHTVRWLVEHLAKTVATRLIIRDSSSLPSLLAAAIKEVCEAHSATCDLANPDSPSSTISIARMREDSLDYLTLGDSPIVLWHRNQDFTAIADDRTSHLPGGRPYIIELVRTHRNKADGFWVASTKPEAAYQAISGTVPMETISEVGLFTDGITRLLDWYGYTWPAIFSSLRNEGPASLIRLVRAAERQQPHPYSKRHDDASAAYLAFP